VRLAWPAVSNHTYRVLAARDPATWAPFSGWWAATGATLTFLVPPPTNGAPHLFRVQAAAPSGPGMPAGVFRVTPQLLPNGQLRLDWAAAPGHGYRVLSSSNGLTWTAAGDWIRATGYTTGVTLFPLPHGGHGLLRVEAQP